jgi:hypothetical protein
MSKAPFTIDPALTAIAIAFRNARMIADDVMPRVTVGKQEFSYLEHNLAEGFTIPDTRVGRRSAPNQVTFSATEKTASTTDHGLDAPVPNADIENAPSNFDPLGHATEQTTNLIALDREVRVSSAVFNTANYAGANTDTLSGNDQWSDPDSSPLVAIMDALDSVIMRPNIAVFGRSVSTALRRHPKIVKAFNGTLGDEGLVPLAFLKELLELDDIYVGEAKLNVARPGQAINLQRVWGPHAAFLYRDRLASTQGGTTWGYSAQWGTRIASQQVDNDIGLRGGVRVRVGESLCELVAAKDLGFLFEDAVAVA